MARWQQPASCVGVTQTLSDNLAAGEIRELASVPNLRSSRCLVVASDYGGEHAGATHQALAFLIADLAGCREWETARHDLRDRYLRDGRRMAYKSLGDVRRRRALFPFLRAADAIPGMLLATLVARSVGTVFDGDLRSVIADSEVAWDRPVFEKLLRVLHFVGFLIAGFSRPGQDVLWVTDQDAIVASDDHLVETTRLLAIISSHYLRHDLGHLRVCSTRSDTGARDLEDLVSIPDLTAGALTDIARWNPSMLKTTTGLVLPMMEDTPRKAAIIASWFAQGEARLRRTAFIIDTAKPKNRLRVRGMVLKDRGWSAK